MRKLLLTTIATLFIAIGMNANTINKYKDDQPFIFIESGIEFAVFQDGQFDFNVLRTNNRGVNVRLNTGIIDFSFNTGHNYDTYVQYDDYNAVIQIENTPVFYDYYGRVIQIGNIHMEYNNNLNLISRIGNMQVNYNQFEECFAYGNINNYNINYNFVPRHRTYRRPLISRAIVYHTPYRRNFTPIRRNYVTYRNNYRRTKNVTRNYRRPGNTSINNNRAYNNSRKVTVNNRRVENRNNRNNNTRVNTNRTITNRNNNTRVNTNRTVTKTNSNTRNNKKYAVKSIKNYKNTKRTVASNNTKNNRR